MEVFKKEVNGQTINYQEITTETVVANPTAEGTEQLQKLQVGNTVYNMPEGGGGNYVLELAGESGTLTDEQYQAVVDNFPNVSILYSGNIFDIMKINVPTEGIFVFVDCTLSVDVISTANWVILPDKSWSVTLEQVKIPPSGGLQVKQITFTDRPSLWSWLNSKWEKILTGVAKMDGKTLNFNTIEDVRLDGVLSSIYISRTSLNYYSTTNISEVCSNTAKITATNVQLEMSADIRVLPDGTVESIAPIIQVLEDSNWSALGVSITITYIE